MKVLVFAREAGGVAAVAPVCRILLENDWDLLILSKDNGLAVFESSGFECIDFSFFDAAYLSSLAKQKFLSLPDLILTSAASMPGLDMTERYLRQWGSEHSVKTVAILDQWQNYGQRFSGAGKDEKLAYMPDYIFVMDELAKDEMITEGIPEDKIIITGQPAFDSILDRNRLSEADCSSIKTDLNLSKTETIVTFAAESLKKDFGNSLGYDEHSTLVCLGNVLEKICTQNKQLEIYLLIKLHPENTYEEFEWALSKWPLLKMRITKNEHRPYEVLAISDIVVGMSSILLVEAILAGNIVVSLQLDSLVGSKMVATKTGAIPFIRSADEGEKVIRSLLLDDSYRNQYLNNEKTWNIKANNAKRCFGFLEKILSDSKKMN